MGCPKVIDLIAQDITGQYRTNLRTITGLYNAAIFGPSNPSMIEARKQLRNSLTDQNERFLGAVRMLIIHYTSAIRDIALAEFHEQLSVNDREAIDHHLASSVDAVMNEVHAILLRDNATVERGLLKVAVQSGAFSANVAQMNMGTMLNRARYDIRFVQPDSMNRNRVSEGFFMGVIRKHTLISYCETKLFHIGRTGNDLAKVVFSDGTIGETFSISGNTPGYRSWEEVSAEVFHPNSTSGVQQA